MLTKTKTFYKTQTWLNPLSSRCTGSVVCYDGIYDFDEKPDRLTFIELADCYQKIKLHKTTEDTVEDFIKKLKLLQADISKFITHLEEKEKADNLSASENKEQ